MAADTGSISEGGPIAINDAGTIAFTAFDDGVFTASGGVITTIATARRRGKARDFAAIIDEPAPFAHIGRNVSINNGGGIVFGAWADSSFGIFTGPNPQWDKVISPGDVLFGATVVAAEIGATALDDAGRIAFRYYLEDGRGGIAVATPEL